MPKILKNTITDLEHLTRGREFGRFYWDDLRIFLACAKGESFRKVGEVLDVSAATLTRHVTQLEDALKTVLFARHSDGFSLTAEGLSLLKDAKEIEMKMYTLLRKLMEGQEDFTKTISEGMKSWDMPPVSWDDIKIFIAYARMVEENQTSKQKAAEKLKISTPTLYRIIARLEEELGVTLFDKEANTLADNGRSLLQEGDEIELEIYELLRSRTTDGEKGIVTISITEGLGTYWLTPKLVEYQQTYPSIGIILRCAMDQADVLRMETDISIQFQRPVNPDLRFLNLGKLHVYPFASQGYIDIYGAPEKDADLVRHRFVQQIAPQLKEDSFLEYFTPEIEDNIVYRTNASTSHFHAIQRGLGIGVLPTYIYATGAPVVPVDVGDRESHSIDIYLTYHPSIKKNPRKAMVIEWVKEIFDSKQYPWFREEFIHPEDLLEYVPEDSRFYSGSSYTI